MTMLTNAVQVCVPAGHEAICTTPDAYSLPVLVTFLIFVLVIAMQNSRGSRS